MIGLYYSGGEDKMSYSVFRDYRISMLRKFMTTMLVGMICLRVGAEDVVCRTMNGNNSHVNCTVPFNNTKLILSCPGDDSYQSVWVKDNCTTKQSVCYHRNCNISDESTLLTNDDSVTYCCRDSTARGTEYHFIHINVTAPPSVYSIEPYQRIHHEDSDVTISVSYYGNGPFTVLWKYNKSEVMQCNKSSENNCYSNDDPVKKTSTLTLMKGTDEDGWRINGDYTANVSNHFGSNQTIIFVRYQCAPTMPQPTFNWNKTINKTEGTAFSEFCRIDILPNYFPTTIVCLTRYTSYTVNEVLDMEPWNCVYCHYNTGRWCSEFDNRTKTSIAVTVDADTSDSCHPFQLTSFGSDGVLLSENGQRILCGYFQKNNLVHFASFQLNVERKHVVNQNKILEPSLIISGAVILLLILCALVCCCCKRRRRKSSNARMSIVESTVDHGGDEKCCDEHTPLIPSYLDSDQLDLRQESLQASLAPGIFPYELDNVGRNSKIVDV